MIAQNGSSNSPSYVASQHSVSQVVDEVLTLAELQMELARSDAQDAVTRIVRPCTMLAAAATAGAAGFLVTLIAIAEGITLLGLPRAASYGIVGLLTIAIGAAVAMTAWKSLRTGPRFFYRSEEEMARNVAWFRNITREFMERATGSATSPRSHQ